MRILLVCSILAACTLLSVSMAEISKRSYKGDMVFKLYPSTPEHHEFIAKIHNAGHYDFWHRSSAKHVSVRVKLDAIDDFIRQLDAINLGYTIAVPDVQTYIDTVESSIKVNKKDTIVGTYASYNDILSWARSLCSTYSSLAQCDTYGTSYEGRDLLYMKLGTVPVGRNNAIFLEAGMHAREWINPASTIYVINELLTKYDSDPTAKRILDTWNFYVTFVSNPDGYEYSRNTERLWRKTRSKSGFCYGVDPNRNYDVAWATTGSSSNPCSDTYHGPNAFSESETKAISDLITQHKDEILGFFAIHSYAQMWLIPYGYTTGLKPTDYDELLRVANIGGTALMAVNNKKWEIGNSADILYACGGASDDWAKIKAEIKYSYTLELRPASGTIGGFIVPESEILPSGRELYAGLVAAIDAMRADD